MIYVNLSGRQSHISSHWLLKEVRMSASSNQSGIWVSRTPDSPYSGGNTYDGKITILVVDDHAPYRRGLRSMIDVEPDMISVGEASDGHEAIEQVEHLKPDIVLMDVNMPRMDGMEATRNLSDTYPNLMIIMLTMFKGEEHLREARRAGASAYVLKDAGSEILLQTIRDVMRGENPLLQREDPLFDSIPLQRPGDSKPPMHLGTDRLVTANERAILRLLATGLSNDQIARDTGLSEEMVRTYLAEIYRKLGLPGREAAAHYAREHGLAEE